MNLDITTLATIASSILIIQLIVLTFLRFTNKDIKGVGYWLTGSLLISFGTSAMLFYDLQFLKLFAMISNPLIILGYIALYIGVLRFRGLRLQKVLLNAIFGTFLISYYFFMFIYPSITLRTVAINLALLSVSALMIRLLVFTKERIINLSARLTVSAFIMTAAFSAVRIFYALTLPPILSYQDQHLLLQFAILTQIVTSSIWTYGFVLMVSQRINLEHDVEREKMQLIFNTSPDAALITQLSDGMIIDVNIGFINSSGYSRDEVIGNTVTNLNLLVNHEVGSQIIAELLDKEASDNHECFFRKKNGEVFMGSISAGISTILDQTYIISVIKDVTERNRQQLALAENEALYRSILNASPDVIAITDLKGTIVMISPVAIKMFGYPNNDTSIIGHHISEFLHPEEMDRANANLEQLFKGHQLSTAEYRAARYDNSTFHIEVSSDFIKNSIGMPNKIIFIIRDITARIIAQQQIKLLLQELDIERNIAQINAITDSLTDIANRRYFDVIMQAEFSRLKRTHSFFSLIMIDVDFFKQFNDEFGHLAGDQVLRNIGSILKEHAHRGSDFVARYGGEEFVVLLPDTDSIGAQRIAESIRLKVEMSNPLRPVTISLGVVTVTQHQVKTTNEAILFADKALYQAKSNGKNQFVVYQIDSDVELGNFNQSMTIEA